MERNSAIFPQADSVERIFKIINVDNVDDIKNKNAMVVVLGDISERQVQYYITAAQFLDILDDRKEFTLFGENLRKSNLFEQRIMISQKIMTIPTFSEVYFTQLVLGIKLEKDDIVSIMKKYVQLSSQSIYERRAQTVMSWIKWINSIDEFHRQ